MTDTLAALIAAQDNGALAIGAPGRDWLDFGGLTPAYRSWTANAG